MLQKSGEAAFAQTRGVKRLMCITTKGAEALRSRCGKLDGWDICIVATLVDAARTLQQQRYLVGLLLDCPDKNSSEELSNFFGNHCDTQWVGVFERQSLEQRTSRDLISDHLCDFHTFPVNPELLRHTLGHAHGWALMREQPRTWAEATSSSHTGHSSAIRKLRAQVTRVATTSAPVLICGESGSGKELVALAIHEQSSRSGGTFVAINCGAMPSDLIQSELFGYERGAFTGATKEKIGLIEAAQDGTIFLDEIADLPMSMQANLLRFLQERTIFRVGGTKSIPVNARVVAASHVDLWEAVEQGKFRSDLFYRLNVLPISVPPLRERSDDIPMLLDEFFKTFLHEKSPRLKGFSNAATLALTEYTWPGNVRELMNRIRRAMILAEGRFITVEDLGLTGAMPSSSHDVLINSRATAEKSAVIHSLLNAQHNVSKAARTLGISRMTLYRLMAKHSVRAQ